MSTARSLRDKWARGETAFGVWANASWYAVCPCCPYVVSSWRNPIFRPFGSMYSARRNATPWSVGAMRKTFGRVAGSAGYFVYTEAPAVWFATCSSLLRL